MNLKQKSPALYNSLMKGHGTITNSNAVYTLP